MAERLDVTNRTEVILLCSRRPIVGEFVLLAEVLAGTHDLAPVLVVPEGLRDSLPQTLPAECKVVFTGQASWSAAGGVAWAIYLTFALLRRMAMLSRFFRAQLLTDFLDTWEAVARGRSLARRVLKLGPTTAAVLTADDRDIRLDQGVLNEARRRGVFTMAVAFGKSDPSTDAFRRALPLYKVDHRPWRRLKARLAQAYPAGVRVNEQRERVFFFRPGEYLALRAHDALFPVPWSYGGGTADKAGVIDREAASMLRDLGVSDSKVLLAGQCSHDALWRLRECREALRARLDAEHGFDPSRPLVILALPPLSEHGMTSETAQQEETAFLFRTLVKVSEKNLLVSLHPRQSPADYRDLAARYGAKLATEALREILPAADLFVAYSSTISWAQLTGIPSVALEYYGFGYTLFANQPGVAVASTPESLVELCERGLRDAGFRHSLMSELADFRAASLFDGKVCERLILEIREGLINDQGNTR